MLHFSDPAMTCPLLMANPNLVVLVTCNIFFFTNCVDFKLDVPHESISTTILVTLLVPIIVMVLFGQRLAVDLRDSDSNLALLGFNYFSLSCRFRS